ncbi:18519_t:CDS:2, partial [Dentiscutata erythropus]
NRFLSPVVGAFSCVIGVIHFSAASFAGSCGWHFSCVVCVVGVDNFGVYFSSSSSGASDFVSGFSEDFSFGVFFIVRANLSSAFSSR